MHPSVCGTLFVIASLACPWLFGVGEPKSWLPFSAIFFATGIVVFRGRRWCEQVLAGTVLIVTVFWLGTVVAIAVTGWPYPDFLRSLLFLVPGLLLCGFWFGMWAMVRRHFRRLEATSLSVPPASTPVGAHPDP